MTSSVTALIAPDNHWSLLAVLFASTFLAVFPEQKYKWASKISGAIITLAVAVVLVNLRVIPSEAPAFDGFVWGYAVPLAIPLLLLQTNLRKIHREAGRFLTIFLIGAAGTADLTLFDTWTQKDADMGGPFDFFGELAIPAAGGSLRNNTAAGCSCGGSCSATDSGRWRSGGILRCKMSRTRTHTSHFRSDGTGCEREGCIADTGHFGNSPILLSKNH